LTVDWATTDSDNRPLFEPRDNLSPAEESGRRLVRARVTAMRNRIAGVAAATLLAGTMLIGWSVPAAAATTGLAWACNTYPLPQPTGYTIITGGYGRLLQLQWEVTCFPLDDPTATVFAGNNTIAGAWDRNGTWAPLSGNTSAFATLAWAVTPMSPAYSTCNHPGVTHAFGSAEKLFNVSANDGLSQTQGELKRGGIAYFTCEVPQ
jgi:hypothetical protein